MLNQATLFNNVSEMLETFESTLGTRQSCQIAGTHFTKKLYFNPGLSEDQVQQVPQPQPLAVVNNVPNPLTEVNLSEQAPLNSSRSNRNNGDINHNSINSDTNDENDNRDDNNNVNSSTNDDRDDNNNVNSSSNDDRDDVMSTTMMSTTTAMQLTTITMTSIHLFSLKALGCLSKEAPFFCYNISFTPLI